MNLGGLLKAALTFIWWSWSKRGWGEFEKDFYTFICKKNPENLFLLLQNDFYYVSDKFLVKFTVVWSWILWEGIASGTSVDWERHTVRPPVSFNDFYDVGISHTREPHNHKYTQIIIVHEAFVEPIVSKRFMGCLETTGCHKSILLESIERVWKMSVFLPITQNLPTNGEPNDALLWPPLGGSIVCINARQ